MTVVLVAGPPMSGVTSLAAVLRERMPDVAVVEEPDERGVAAVVLAVSGVAPPADSDLAVLDAATRAADGVVGAVTKTDAHRSWRDVRDRLNKQYGDVPWIGVSAAPQLGEPDAADLVVAVRAVVNGESATRLRRLRARRAGLLRDHRSARTAASAALRTGLHRERLALGGHTRERCAGLRAEMRTAAAEMPRRSVDAVEHRARGAADDVLSAVGARVDRRLADLADVLGAPRLDPWPMPTFDVDGPPSVSRRAERGLTLALGAGFGLGIAVAAGRLVAMLAPWLSVAAQAAGAALGLALTAWLVATRELLHDRAVVDRWVCDVAAALRGHVDDAVAGRLLDAETCFGRFLADRAADEAGELTRRIAVIDAELRTLADAADE